MSDEFEPESLGVPADPAPGPAALSPVRAMDAARFAFATPHAGRKLAVASLWLLIPVFGAAAVHGWSAEAFSRLHRHHPEPLPPLHLRDFAHYARRGRASLFVTVLGFAALASLVLGLFVALNTGLLAALIATGGLGWAALLGAFAAILVITALGGLVVSAVQTRAELSGRVGTALQTGEVAPHVRRTFVRAATAYATLTPIAAVVLGVGLALCGVGLLPALVVVRVMGMHLRWQLYEHHLRRGGREVPTLPPALLPSEARLLPKRDVKALGA